MTAKEIDILQAHGERLAKIEETLYNHVLHQLQTIDKRLWWLMGLIVANALAMWFAQPFIK